MKQTAKVKNRPWICVRGLDERVKGQFCRQVGPGFRTRRYGRSRKEAVFRCCCGTYFVCKVDMVKLGRTKSCGCLRKGLVSRPHPVVATTRNIQTRYLTQVGIAFWAGSVMAVFSCVCGQRAVIATHHVVAGNTQTCGCCIGRSSTQLSVEIQYLDQLKACGIDVNLECVSLATMSDRCDSLQQDIGHRRFGHMIGRKDPEVGWRTGNIEWQHFRVAIQNREARVMGQMLKEIERLRFRITEPAWRRGTEADRIAAIVRDCGRCPSEYHTLQRLHRHQGWGVGNVQWLLPSAVFQQLAEMEQAMIDRASRVRRNPIGNHMCPKCRGRRTRVSQSRANRGYRIYLCNDCAQTFRVGITDTEKRK